MGSTHSGIKDIRDFVRIGEDSSYQCSGYADSRAHALVANGGGVFKMLGYTRGDSLAENRAIMNKQVCVLKLFLE